MEIPEGFANVRFVYSLSGVADEMSFAIGVSPPTASEASEIAFAADTAYAAAGFGGSPGMYVGWSYLGTRVVKKFGGQPQVGDYVIASVGSAAGQTVPPNCSLLVKKNTALGGRKGRGRLFVPPYGLADTMVSNAGFLEDAQRGILQTAWDSLITELNANNLVPTLFHSDPLDLPTTITSFTVQAQLATQRRRMR